MKKKARGIVSLVLVLAMCVSIPATAFAKESVSSDEGWETVYVELEDGSVVAVEVRESGSAGGVAPASLTPEYPVGTKRSYEVNISNEDLDAPADAVGTVLMGTYLSRLQKLTVAAVNTRAGQAIITVAALSAAVAWSNEHLFGNNGFEVVVDLEYFGTYINSQGHYIYGWDVTSVDIDTY